ncbi:hypothetical protein F2Q69_00037818 [Brassica cretica]|uniref:Uncharacterized protein n=1 Tax=Brassica cretica TaxID=69181 RepID=A0A8S9SRD2_BRACR|nr:hypothetical protein F2Q69_00037818 [Brassica cretica]
MAISIGCNEGFALSSTRGHGKRDKITAKSGACLGCELRWRACRLTLISASMVHNGESAIVT